MLKKLKKKVILFIVIIGALYGIFAMSDNCMVTSLSDLKNKILNIKQFNLGEIGVYTSTLIGPATLGIIYAIISMIKKKTTLSTYLLDIVAWVGCNGLGIGVSTLLDKYGVSMDKFPQLAINNLDLPTVLAKIVSQNTAYVAPILITSTPILTSVLVKAVKALLVKH